MDTNQIYTLVNSTAEQALGSSAITAIDTSTLVSLGNVVLSSSANTESFLNTLVQRIGKTIYSFREYKNKFSDMVLNDFEYGAILQKIKVAMPEAVEDDAYNLVDGESIDMYEVAKPVVTQKLFVKRTPYLFRITIARSQLKEAFLNAESMGAFIGLVFGEVRNAIEFALENLGRATLANFVAEKKTAEIKLVTDYNSETGSGLTAETALHDPEFLNYAIKRINETIDNMQDMSVLYSDGSTTRHTPLQDMRIRVLSSFIRAAETVTQYAAFNKNLVSIDSGYKKYTYWQSVDDRAGIKVSKRASDETAYTLENLICVIHDRDALGIYQIDEEVATSPVNARGLYYNQFWHERQLWFNDLSENFAFFTLN